MVRRAQLQRKTGSPLISGYLTPRAVNWGWIVAALLALAIAGAGVWYVWLR